MGNHGHGLIPTLKEPPELQREIRQGKKRKGRGRSASKGQSQCPSHPPQGLSDSLSCRLKQALQEPSLSLHTYHVWAPGPNFPLLCQPLHPCLELSLAAHGKSAVPGINAARSTRRPSLSG